MDPLAEKIIENALASWETTIILVGILGIILVIVLLGTTIGKNLKNAGVI